MIDVGRRLRTSNAVRRAAPAAAPEATDRSNTERLAGAGRSMVRGFLGGALVVGLSHVPLIPLRAQLLDASSRAGGATPAATRQAVDMAPTKGSDGTGEPDDGQGPGVHDEDPGETGQAPDDPGETPQEPVEEPVDDVAPSIEVFCGDVPLEDEAVLSQASLLIVRVREHAPQKDGEGRPTYSVHLTNKGLETTVELGEWRPTEEEDVYELVLADGEAALVDGSYGLDVSCQDAAGNAARLERSFAVDMQAPTVVVGLEDDALVGWQANGSAYARGPLAVSVELADATLDETGSTVLGAPLSALCADTTQTSSPLPKGVSVQESVRGKDERGLSSLHLLLLFDEGTYDVRDLMRAKDSLVRETCGTLQVQGNDLNTLVVDATAPKLSLEALPEGSSTREDVTLRLHVHDENLGALACLDPSRTLMRLECDGKEVARLAVGYEGASPEDVEHVYQLEVKALPNHENDGTYVLTCDMADLAGNVAKPLERRFAMDTTPPQLSVSFDDDETHNQPHALRYFAQPRVAHIVLRERNLLLEELNSQDPLVRVLVSAREGRTASDVDRGDWRELGAGTFACDVAFPANGSYELKVEGADAAGNLLVGAEDTPVDDEGRYDSGRFVLDDEAPTIRVSYAPATPEPMRHKAVDYFKRPVSLHIEVSDRNFDRARTTVEDAWGNAQVLSWRDAGTSSDGTHIHVAEVLYGEEGTPVKRPLVHAYDKAGNESTMRVPAFAVDQSAPVIRSVRTSAEPTTVSRRQPGDDPVYYYGQAADEPVTLTFAFEDEQGIARAWVHDPDGVYDVEAREVAGKTSGKIVLRLEDQEQVDGGRDAQLDRTVVLCVRDLAGNVREWTLDRKGRVVTTRAYTAQNVSLDDGGVFPLALVRDATAPVVSIAGVEEGAYYASAQVARIEVRERLFSHILRFDRWRVVATVDRWDATPGRAHSSWDLEAHEFEGEDPLYVFEQSLLADGHYAIRAEVEDMARNRSNHVLVREFTIDTTAPLIQVSWDNTDVRNGFYYNAVRVATVSVVEHNFDPTLVSIKTSGSVGAWRTSGDTHSCEVVFARDSSPREPHTLKVEARDLAGNEAMAHEESPFVIDTVAPSLSILKRVSTDDAFAVTPHTSELVDGSAFAQGIEPVVVCADEASFDAAGVEVSMVGGRGTTINPVLAAQEGGERLEWPNLGLDESGEEPSYLVEADDIYTIRAQVRDLAGNQSVLQEVRFSVNRYGSNFFVETLEDSSGVLSGSQEGGDAVEQGRVPLLTQAPCVVIHEVNASGAQQGEGDDAAANRVVTKEHAHATSEIALVQDEGASDGYGLLTSLDGGDSNAPDGWSEYVYTIRAGNFGKGSSSDNDDGGQGLYRIDVSSRDLANNLNSTARFWKTGADRKGEAQQSSATVTFALDEEGPRIEDLVLPQGICVGSEFEASFRLEDEITNGDEIRVLVDGQEVEVLAEGSDEPVDEDGQVTHQGEYRFLIPARPLTSARRVDILVSDYTGLSSRTQRASKKGFAVTTLVPELACCFALLCAALALRMWVAHRVPPRT